MEVKNNLVKNINRFNKYLGEDSNSSEYRNNNIQNDINTEKIISNELKSNFSSYNFDESRDNEEFTKKDLDYALKKVNDFLKEEKTHAEYSVHEDLGRVMIKIVDDESNNVILEIPPKKILDMVASMCRQAGLLDKKA